MRGTTYAGVFPRVTLARLVSSRGFLPFFDTISHKEHPSKVAMVSRHLEFLLYQSTKQHFSAGVVSIEDSICIILPSRQGLLLFGIPAVRIKFPQLGLEHHQELAVVTNK